MKYGVSDGVVNQYQRLHRIGHQVGEEGIPVAGLNASEIKFFSWYRINRLNGLGRNRMAAQHVLELLVFSNNPLFCAKLIDEHTETHLRHKNIVDGFVATNLWLAI